MSVRFASLAKCLWILAALTCVLPSAARACEATIRPVTTTVRLDYDPFAFVPTAGQWLVEVENRANEACDADLVLLDAAHVATGDIDVGGTGVVATVTAGDAALLPTSSPGTWRVRLQPAGRVKLALDVRVTRDAVATAGEHASELSLDLRDAGSIVASARALPATLVLVAPPRAQMNIAGAAATFGQGASVARVDFGTLSGTVTRRVFLQIRSNTRARLTIDSANHGRLLPSTETSTETGIPYTAQLSDEAVDLTKHWEREVVPQPSLAGTSLPFDLSVAEPGAHMEGTYSDLLTLELTAI